MFSADPCQDDVRPSKRIPALITAFVLLVLLSPLAENWKDKPVDSFPLSHFPMFSAKRAKTFTGNALMGVDADGNRVLLSYRLAGHGGFNQVRRQLASKLKEKQGDEVCQQVAANVAQSRKRSLRQIEAVQIVSAKHQVDRFFARRDSQLSEKVYATCPVPRESQLTISKTALDQSTSEVTQ